MTHTLAILQISPEAFRDIENRIRALGSDYDFMFIREMDGALRIDMTGIALEPSGADDAELQMRVKAHMRKLLNRATLEEMQEAAKVSEKLKDYAPYLLPKLLTTRNITDFMKVISR